MKHISDGLTLNAPFKRETPKQVNEGTILIVNELFKRFDAIFPTMRTVTFKTTQQLNAAKREWLEAFVDEGINTEEQLEAGLRQCRLADREFMPTIGQFIKWCNAIDNATGVPSLDSAYDEACKNSHPASDKVWSHKLVAHAWKLTGSYLLSNSARSNSFPVFQRNYEIAIREWRAGKPIADIEIPLAINAPVKSELSQELRKKAIADCLKMLKS